MVLELQTKIMKLEQDRDEQNDNIDDLSEEVFALQDQIDKLKQDKVRLTKDLVDYTQCKEQYSLLQQTNEELSISLK